MKVLLCGIGAMVLTACVVAHAAEAAPRDVARVKGMDGVWTEVPLVGVREADGGVRYTFPAAEADGVCVPAMDYVCMCMSRLSVK